MKGAPRGGGRFLPKVTVLRYKRFASYKGLLTEADRQSHRPPFTKRAKRDCHCSLRALAVRPPSNSYELTLADLLCASINARP